MVTTLGGIIDAKSYIFPSLYPPAADISPGRRPRPGLHPRRCVSLAPTHSYCSYLSPDSIQNPPSTSSFDFSFDINSSTSLSALSSLDSSYWNFLRSSGQPTLIFRHLSIQINITLEGLKSALQLANRGRDRSYPCLPLYPKILHILIKILLCPMESLKIGNEPILLYL